MTRFEIETIRRAAQAAIAVRIAADLPIQIAFRATDIFARLVTPEAVVDLCNEALADIPVWDESCGPSEAEIADAEASLADADRYRMARRLNVVTALDEVNIDLAIVREFDRAVGDTKGEKDE